MLRRHPAAKFGFLPSHSVWGSAFRLVFGVWRLARTVAGLAGTIGSFIAVPCDLVKIRMQADAAGTRYRSTAASAWPGQRGAGCNAAPCIISTRTQRARDAGCTLLNDGNGAPFKTCTLTLRC